jgi:hypothetical protein
VVPGRHGHGARQQRSDIVLAPESARFRECLLGLGISAVRGQGHSEVGQSEHRRRGVARRAGGMNAFLAALDCVLDPAEPVVHDRHVCLHRRRWRNAELTTAREPVLGVGDRSSQVAVGRNRRSQPTDGSGVKIGPLELLG